MTRNTFKWSKEYQNLFDTIKLIISKKTMLYYLNYNLPFSVFSNASDKQLGTHMIQINDISIDLYNMEIVLKQDYYPVLFYICKLNHF